jgi:transposase, IS6 family
MSPQRGRSLFRRRDLRETPRVLAVLYRAVDQYGQVIDVFLSKKRDLRAAAFFANAIRSHGEPAEVTTDRADALVRAIAELLSVVPHATRQYANNRVGADHGRLNARLRPMRDRKRHRTASVIIEGHAFMQNLRRGHYELGSAHFRADYRRVL